MLLLLLLLAVLLMSALVALLRRFVVLVLGEEEQGGGELGLLLLVLLSLEGTRLRSTRLMEETWGMRWVGVWGGSSVRVGIWRVGGHVFLGRR